MTDHAEALASMRAAGRRITSQRQLVLDVLEATAGHLDAEAIYQRAKENHPHISLATVYRTLAVLKEMELVDPHFITRDHGQKHYEPMGAPEHYHFTCLGCRNVIEFQSLHVEQIRAELNDELGLEVSRTCICLEGYCPTCAAKREAVDSEGV